MNIKNFLSVSICLFACLVANELSAQRVGDRVVITADFETKIRTTKVGKVYGGSINTITQIQKKWCLVEGVKGWLPLQYTMSLDSAKKVYEKRIAANEKDYDAHSVLAMIAYERGDINSALASIAKALNINNRIASMWNNRAIILSAANKLDEALRDINIAIQLNEKYAGAYGNRGLIHVGMGKLDLAVADFSKAIELDSKNPNHYKNRGGIYQTMAEYSKAMSDFNSAIRLNPRYFKAYIGRANIYLARDDLQNAYLNATEAVKHGPRSAAAHNNLGWVRFRRNDLANAVTDFTRAINLDDEMAIAFSNRGVVYTDQGKFKQAIDDFNRALKINPRSGITFNNRANAWIGMKNYAKAKKDFQTAIKLAPELTDALNGYAWFLATCPEKRYRKGDEAKGYVEKAIKLAKGDNWNLLDTLAATLAEQEQYDKAVKAQELALQLAPKKNQEDFGARLKLYQNEKPYRAKSGKSQQNNG